jgi:hypothetical protein
MSFKENLLRKIEIDRSTQKVIGAIGPSESGRRIDKDVVRDLLVFGMYEYVHERDLDLYVKELIGDKKRIVVLDNELAIYHTTIADVALRKSPTVKEMISIRNAIKILNDGDVVVSKREESVKTIRNECIGMLDLTFQRSDIDDITNDGIASLDNGYADGVIECLEIFAEILGYTAPPNAFRISNHKIVGKRFKNEKGGESFGPMVLYSLIHNTLKSIEETIPNFEKDKIAWIQRVAAGKEDPSAEGPPVFEHLKEAVIRGNVWAVSSA